MSTLSDSLPGWFRRRKKRDSADEAVSSKSLSDSVTGGEYESEPVEVWEASNRMEAEIVKAHLESEGIPALITGEAVGPIFSFTTGDLAKASVFVPAPLAERAREVLAYAANDDAVDEYEGDEDAADDAADDSPDLDERA